MYRSIFGTATIACLLCFCHMALAETYLPSAVHALDADLIESRAIAGLEFNDPGSVQSFLERARQQRQMMDASRNVAGSNTYAPTSGATTADMGTNSLGEEDTARLLAVKEKYGSDMSAHFEQDMHADHELENALEQGNWMNSLGDHMNNANAVASNTPISMAKRDQDPQMFSLIDKSDRKLNEELYGKNRSPGQPQHEPNSIPASRLPPVRVPKITLGQRKFEGLELGNLQEELKQVASSQYPDARAVAFPNHVAAIKQMEHDVEETRGTLTYPFLRKLSTEIKTISGASERNVTDHLIVDMIKERQQGINNVNIHPSADAIAPNGRDVVDCTACRFAWLNVEKDLGHSTDPVALYDAFVRHCGKMQLSNIFYAPCTDMFSKVEGMIGSYLSGMTVNQMCVSAEMCR